MGQASCPCALLLTHFVCTCAAEAAHEEEEAAEEAAKQAEEEADIFALEAEAQQKQAQSHAAEDARTLLHDPISGRGGWGRCHSSRPGQLPISAARLSSSCPAVLASLHGGSRIVSPAVPRACAPEGGGSHGGWGGQADSS